jgi:hypothetical protein
MTKLAIWFDENGLKNEISIDDYENLYQSKNKEKLANFIYNRFHSRYIKPFINKEKHYKKEFLNGFSIMANCCLTIEAFESFKRGWKNSKKKSRLTFKYFFSSETKFIDFNSIVDDFYDNVRCGILHQGETTGGWKISRGKDTLFDKSTKTIDAELFLKFLDNSINLYCDNLKNQDFNESDWNNVFKKMNEIIANCN